MKNLLEEIKRSPIKVAMSVVIAVSAVVAAVTTITSYNTLLNNRKIDDMASYLNTTPGLIKMVCTNKEEGEYLVPDKEEREAICSLNVETMFKYTKEKQGEAQSSQENEVIDQESETETNTESQN